MEEQMIAERLEHARIKWLMIGLLGFILWDGIRILQGYILKTQSSPILIPLELFGWLLWAVSLIQIIRLGSRIKGNTLLQRMLNDELVMANRMKAWKTGFIVILCTQIVLLLSCSFIYSFSAALGAEVTIFLGVISSLIAFIRLHH